VLAAADAFAQRVAQFQGTPQQMLEYAFQLAFGRVPQAAETAAAMNFFRSFTGKSGVKDAKEAKRAALSAFCQSLLASAEFRYLN
jgi:hypothetical protein